jgi:hypothetical protein
VKSEIEIKFSAKSEIEIKFSVKSEIEIKFSAKSEIELKFSVKSEIEIQSKSKFQRRRKRNTIEIKMFSQNTVEIQSKLKFSVKAKAKYNRNRNSEGYPTLLIPIAIAFVLFLIFLLIPPKACLTVEIPNQTTNETTPRTATPIQFQILRIFILNSSGSIEQQKSTTIKSFNKLIEKNKRLTNDKTIFSLIHSHTF